MLTEAFLMLLRNDNTTARGNQAKSYLPPNRKPVRARPSAPHGLSLRRISRPQARNKLASYPNRPEFSRIPGFFPAACTPEKTPLARQVCSSPPVRRPAGSDARSPRSKSSSPGRSAAGRETSIGTERPSRPFRPDPVVCLYTAPPRRRGCPARRRTRRRAASRPAS